MNHPRTSAAATTSAGLAVVACSVLMAFLADHYWLIGYDTMLLFEKAFLWVQIAGLVMFIGGCLWLVVRLSPQVALFVGIAFAGTASLLPLLFGGYLAILNVHSWTVTLLPPLIILFVCGVLLAAGGFIRRIRQGGVENARNC
jgi:hypothetical protein